MLYIAKGLTRNAMAWEGEWLFIALEGHKTRLEWYG